MHITVYFDAERRRDMEARAEVSRIVRAARRRRSGWGWLRPSFLASRPDLVPAPPHSDLAPAPPLPDLVPAPPEPQPAATLPLPALSGTATGHQASPAA